MSVTVRLPDDLARRVEKKAAERHMSAEEVALEAIESRFPADEAPAGKRRLAFVAIGRSGSIRGGTEADDLLAEGFGRDWVLLVDTGPLVAAADEDDARHADCRRLFESGPGPLVTNAMVLAEAAYLIARQLGAGADARLLESVADSTLRVESLDLDDYARAGELVREYASLRLGATDASLVALAERLGVTTIATLNRRDFAVVRPRHAAAFELVP